VDVRTPDDFKKWVAEQKAAVKQAATQVAQPQAIEARVDQAPHTAQVLPNP